MSRLLAGIFIFLNVLNYARAWNAEGHMVTAQIAYDHLTPMAKARCDALIAVPLTFSSTGTSNFVTAAAWADDFKTQLGTAIWHYIDIPISLDGTSTSGVAADSFDVVRAINLCITNLQDAAASESNRAVSLRYLVHFVGDIEQPLHCSTGVTASMPGGDAGGNDFSITGQWDNLHSLWDAGGGFLTDSISRPLTTAGSNTLNAKVMTVEAAYPYDYGTNLGAIPDPMTWALESWNLARTNAYVNITRSAAPSTTYLNTTMATTEQRMATGGHRLADLLNTLFMSPTLTAVSLPSGNFKFSWNAVSNTTYRVQWKSQLSDAAWTDLTTIIAASNSAAFTEASGPTQRFYRLVQ
jgi:S1/P1 Nuclease